MNYYYGVIFVYFFLTINVPIVLGQVQTIRGSVVDTDSNYPLPGVTIVVLDQHPSKGAVTDVNGKYEINNVALGRVSLQYRSVGYRATFLSEQLLEAGKELILNISLIEDIQELEELVILSDEKGGVINSETALVGIRSFAVAETKRYAGARNDVARMVSNYAGVSSGDDSRNDIVIRGNSPVGLLWRLEGIDIPSPNHFSSFTSTGGPVSLLNNNNLSNSDFITSAFPADYGNTIAGIFDLKLKAGNSFTREHTGQVGFNGFELGAEGPFGKQANMSYMANFRYSTLGLFKALGVDFGTGTAVPEYMDLTFATDFYSEKTGRFKFFGIGGTSQIHFQPTEKEGVNGNTFSSEDLLNKTKIGILGLNHIYYFNSKTYLSSSLAASYQYNNTVIDSIYNNEVRLQNEDLRQHQEQVKYSWNTKWVAKIDAKRRVELGINLNSYKIAFQDSLVLSTEEWFRYTDIRKSNILLAQLHTQYQIRLNQDWKVVAGVHYQWLTNNQSQAIEPRIAMVYEAKKNTKVNVGYGLHSQTQPLIAYYRKFRNTTLTETNEALGFTKSHHLTLDLGQQFKRNIHLKLEAYYQYLFDVPIQSTSSSYSILNSGASFGFELEPNLVNSGLGKNYGIELTLEKTFSDSYYFLFTTSLFDSKYRASDGRWRNTAFNNNFVLNVLGGKEIKIGKFGILTSDVKMTYSKGRRYTPINLAASKKSNEAVYQTNEAFSLQYAPYFRVDLKIGFRLNMKKISQEWTVDVQNIFNRKNVHDRFFNTQTGIIDQRSQLGILIIPQYRIYF